MALPEKRILDFLSEQRVLTLATCSNNIPHCAICYYVYSQQHNSLIFKSATGSRHVRDGLINNTVGVSIISSSGSEISRSKGAQIEAEFKKFDSTHLSGSVKRSYYKHYPLALAIPGELFVLELVNIKFIDNTLGFATKLTWEKAHHPDNS